jgi:hypothetical protein
MAHQSPELGRAFAQGRIAKRLFNHPAMKAWAGSEDGLSPLY